MCKVLQCGFASAILVAALPLSATRADVVYTYTGTIDRLEYNRVDPATLSPFSVGQTISAQFRVPNFTTGSFQATNGIFSVDRVIQPFPAGIGGSVQFGATQLLWEPLNSVALGGATMDAAVFCCAFGQPFPGSDNGQAFFRGGDVRAVYLPTGQTLLNVTAYGSGSWTVEGYQVPEPLSLALFGTALAAFVAARRRRDSFGSSATIA